jgi:hypothetical protein
LSFQRLAVSFFWGVAFHTGSRTGWLFAKTVRQTAFQRSALAGLFAVRGTLLQSLTRANCFNSISLFIYLPCSKFQLNSDS